MICDNQMTAGKIYNKHATQAELKTIESPNKNNNDDSATQN